MAVRTINNDYDSIAERWWSDESGATATIRYFVNPVRFAYFKNILDATCISGYAGGNALDVGCGGGFLSEELAKIGLSVTGVDPSVESIRIAAAHAAGSRLCIDYAESSGEDLPFEDSSFDMVFCCDVLEHVNDINTVISEISRVLKKGGLFFFDTINRTPMSWIAVIYFMQRCPLTAFDMPDGHVWSMFIRPGELTSMLRRNGLTCMNVRGIAPARKGLQLVMGLYRASRKRISYRELGEMLRFTESDDLSCSYMGYGIKD